MAKVSICTTTARAGFFEHEHAMLLAQTGGHEIELVFIDFDYENRKGLVELCYASRPGIAVTHYPQCTGGPKFFRDISRNRNKALACATGDYIIFLDDYACIPPEFVDRHMDIMSMGAISCGQMHRLDAETTPALLAHLPLHYGEALSRFPAQMGRDFRNNRGDQSYKSQAGITYTGNLGFPRAIFEAINGFDPRMEGSLEDCDFGLRADRAGYATYFNPAAYTINLNTGGIPYVFSHGHDHDNEPFISNPNNNYRGDATLSENEFMTVEFCDHYRIAHCKKCGAQGMIDPNELIAYKMQTNQLRVPEGLPGGLDTLRQGGTTYAGS